MIKRCFSNSHAFLPWLRERGDPSHPMALLKAELGMRIAEFNTDTEVR